MLGVEPIRVESGVRPEHFFNWYSHGSFCIGISHGIFVCFFGARVPKHLHANYSTSSLESGRASKEQKHLPWLYKKTVAMVPVVVVVRVVGGGAVPYACKSDRERSDGGGDGGDGGGSTVVRKQPCVRARARMCVCDVCV